MYVVPSPPSAPAGRSSGRRLLGLVGRLVALVLIAGAGVAGWFAVDRLVVAEPVPWGAVPAAGEGLPAEHLDGVDLPRAFRLDDTGDALSGRIESRWFDLDADVIATRSDTLRREFHAGRGFELGADGAWTEMAPEAAVAARRAVSSGSGPFLLTDIVPPASSSFVTIVADEMIVADDGPRRRITLVVDVAAFGDAHPVAAAEWRSVVRSIEPAEQRWTIDVDGDGIVHRLEQGDVVRTWTPLVEPIALESPLRVAADSATGVGAGPPPVDGGP